MATEEIKEEAAVVEKEFVHYVIALQKLDSMKGTVDALFDRDLHKWQQLHVLENSFKNFEKHLKKLNEDLNGYGRLQELNQLRTDSIEQKTDDLDDKVFEHDNKLNKLQATLERMQQRMDQMEKIVAHAP